MNRFLVRWFISSIALLIVVHIFSGVSSQNILSLFIMALVLGFLNTFFRPLLVLLSLPLTIVSLGLFTLVINAIIFYIAAHLVSGIYIAGFWSAFWASILYSITTFFINSLVCTKNDNSNACWRCRINR